MEKRSRFFLCAQAIQWHQNPKREGRITERTGILSLFGGLALFLFGMDRMSEALQQAAGGAAAAGIGSPDPHPADRGAGRDGGHGSDAKQLGHHGHGHWVCQCRAAGAPQAVAVIFGANIGTTVTAQLLAFRVEEMLGLVLFGGFFSPVQWPGQSGGGRWGRRCFHSGCSLRGWSRSRAWWSRWPSARSLRPDGAGAGKSRSGVCCWGWG